MSNQFYCGLRVSQTTRPVFHSARDNIQMNLSSSSSSSMSPGHGGLEVDQQELLATCHQIQNQNNSLLTLQVKMNNELQLLQKETQDARKEAKEVREMVI